MDNKVKCSKCNSEDYKVINSGNKNKKIVELRQCKKCFRKYKVEIDGNKEKLL